MILRVSAILFAAGLSRRMGVDKLLLDYQGKLVLQHALDLLSDLSVYEKILVTTKERLDFVKLPPDIQVAINKSPEKGMSGSIHIGIEAATGTHYLFLNADQPRLTPDDLRQLLETASTNTDRIIFSSIDSKPNSPTLFPNRFRKDLLSLSGDTGGRIIRDAYPENCLAIEHVDPRNLLDIDTVEDYNKMTNDK